MDLRNEGRFNERAWKLSDGITKAGGVGDVAGGGLNAVSPGKSRAARAAHRELRSLLRLFRAKYSWRIFARAPWA